MGDGLYVFGFYDLAFIYNWLHVDIEQYIDRIWMKFYISFYT